MTLFVGVDAGVNGAIACIDEQANVIGVYDMPQLIFGKFKFCDALELLARFSEFRRPPERQGEQKKLRAYIEHASVGPSRSIQAASQLGRSLGCCVSAMRIGAVPFEMISPQKWKGDMQVTRPGGTDKDRKDASLSMARAIFPTAELHLQKHHNRAEALLIAEYGRRRNVGGL